MTRDNETKKIVLMLLRTMTPAEIAVQVGATVRSVENWRSGERRASPVFLCALRMAAMARGVR